jgi:hypothetical protein
MPTVLDSFVLEFGLDHRQFTRSEQDVLDQLSKFEQSAVKGGQSIESQTKKVYDVLSNFRREALTTLALFFGGKEIGQFVDHITRLDAATGRLGLTLGMSARETSAWQGAIRQAGGTTEGANAALAGLSGEMNRFQLTGQSAMLPVLSRLGIGLYDQNRNLKTAGQLWLELSDAISGMDPRQAQAFLAMIPGANQDMINFALLGRRAMEQYLDAARTVGTTTEQSAAAAQEYRRSLELLESSGANLGRTLVTLVAPALSTVANSMSRLFSSWTGATTPSTGAGSRNALVQRFGSPRRIFEWLGEHSPFAGDKEDFERWATQLYGPKGADEMSAAREELARRLAAAASGSPAGSTNEVEDYIRRAATARGMDPNVAVAVAKSEGLYNYVGDQGTSFGPFQLHYGGGQGDIFTKKTGLNARDPSTWKAQVDFSLDQAKAGGWGPWHGWKGSPFAGGAGVGGAAGGRNVNINVGGVTVNTSSSNGEGIASDVDGALRRSLKAGAANYGSQ